jgi:hypothetical protein
MSEQFRPSPLSLETRWLGRNEVQQFPAISLVVSVLAHLRTRKDFRQPRFGIG